MTAYEVLELGSPDGWHAKGKVFVDREIETEYIGISANAFEPGQETSGWHAHSVLEEIYLFLDGKGQMALDADVVEVGPGTTIRVGQGVQRRIRALPDSPGELRYLCVRAAGGPLKEIPRDVVGDAERPKPW